MIGNLLVVLTRAKELEQGYDIPLIDDSFPDSPLSSWRDEDWEMFDEYLHAIGENLKRKDVDATPFDPENREIDAEVAQDDSINNNMEKINLYIQINKAVSPIRNDLTKQIDDQNIDDDAHPKLDSKLVAKVW